MSRYRSSYGSSSDSSTWISAGLLVLLIIICGCGAFGKTSGTQAEVTAKILNADIAKDGESSIYLIDVEYADGTTEVLAVKDNSFAGLWNSRDVYFALKNNTGTTYKFTVVGWRVPFLSWHREIIKYQKVEN